MQSARWAWEEWLTGFRGEGLARVSLFQNGSYSHLQKWMLTRIWPWWWKLKGHPSLCRIRMSGMVLHSLLGLHCPISLLTSCLPWCGLTPLPGHVHHAAATRASRPVGSRGQVFSDSTCWWWIPRELHLNLSYYTRSPHLPHQVSVLEVKGTEALP